MRSETAKLGKKRTHERKLRGPHRELARKSMLSLIAVEALEPRTLMAVLATPTVLPNSQVDVSDFVGSVRGYESSPTIAIDQLNPNKLAAVWVRNAPPLPAPSNIFVQMATSIDGGQNWTSQVTFQPISNPTATA